MHQPLLAWRSVWKGQQGKHRQWGKHREQGKHKRLPLQWTNCLMRHVQLCQWSDQALYPSPLHKSVYGFLINGNPIVPGTMCRWSCVSLAHYIYRHWNVLWQRWCNGTKSCARPLTYKGDGLYRSLLRSHLSRYHWLTCVVRVWTLMLSMTNGWSTWYVLRHRVPLIWRMVHCCASAYCVWMSKSMCYCSHYTISLLMVGQWACLCAKYPRFTGLKSRENPRHCQRYQSNMLILPSGNDSGYRVKYQLCNWPTGASNQQIYRRSPCPRIFHD